MLQGARIWQVLTLLALAGVVVLGWLYWQAREPQPGDVPQAVSLPPVGFEIVNFSELPGWAVDDPRAAIEPFLRSCEALLQRPESATANPVEYVSADQPYSFAGTVGDWRLPCEDALALYRTGNVTMDAARAFFEDHFVPVQMTQPLLEADIAPEMTVDGLFTGYFEPVYAASAVPTEEFSAPVLARPEDLVTVDLGLFRPDMRGSRLAGRVENGMLLPYETHAEINRQPPQADVLAWMNPNDLLFMQIQGSGRLDLDGRDVSVGYAAPNGHPYTAIGRELVEMGEIALEDVTMQSIYEWLEQAPSEEAARVREVNQSYIFFRPMTQRRDPALGPIGAQGVQLTSGRSIAVDRRYHAMGAPVWVDLDADDQHPYPLQRLMIAQDTGGAIRGPVRGDVFVGSGREAGAEAGTMRRNGRLYALLPAAVAERLESHATQKDPDA